MKKHITIQGIDADLWRQFRAACVRLGINVGDRLNQLIAMWLEEFKKDME